MKINLKIIDWKLKYKVVFHIFVIGLLSMAVLFVLFMNSEKDLISTLNTEKTEIVGGLIESNINHQLTTDGVERVIIKLDEMTGPRGLDRLRILNIEGRITNSSQPDEIGSYVPDSERALLEKFYSDTNREDYFTIIPFTRTRNYLALENREECTRCHSPSNKQNGILEVKFDESLEAALLHRSRIQGVVIALSTLFILTFVIYRLFGRVINRPLQKLIESMSRVREGDMGLRLDARKKDEFGDLALSFNDMVDRLGEANREIEELHTRQMEKAGHLASLGELAAGLAHEIKNPIAGIKGAIETISQQSAADDPRKEIFEEILKQTDRMHTIIQDLLHYARPRELVKRRVNPNECIQDAIRMAEPQTGGRDIRFHFFPLGKDVTAYLDCDKIQEVVLNLLLNGIAATENEGEITIVLEHYDGELAIRIEDTGKGIPQEHLTLIFNPFFTTRKQGTGLGLSLCRQIIQAHNGTIEARSRLNRGTVFTIRLPIYRQEETA